MTQFIELATAKARSGVSLGDIIKWTVHDTYCMIVSVIAKATAQLPIGTMLDTDGAVTLSMDECAAIVLDTVQVGMTTAKTLVRGPAIINIGALITSATNDRQANFARHKALFESSPLGQTGVVALSEGTDFGVQENGTY